MADLLQDLAVQTACLGMYSSTQAGTIDRITNRYIDPPDWYTPPILANRFASMSGNMTRTITFYGICFDYAQFAYDDIAKYQAIYSNAGMKQYFIAVANYGDPNTIILYDPVSRDKATTIWNGIPVKENSRHRVRTHDDATGHAWLWVQHKNGTWYWIDPTWTDNTGYPWWGIVENNKEVQYYPNEKYVVANNYPRPNNRENRSPSSSYTNYSPPPPPPPPTTQTRNNYYNYHDYFIGYNYVSGFPMGESSLPWGMTIGLTDYYASLNIEIGEETGNFIFEWTIGMAVPLLDFCLFPIGLGANHTSVNDNINHKFVIEIGIMPILFNYLYISATYRLTGFNKHGFTLGAGIIF